MRIGLLTLFTALLSHLRSGLSAHQIKRFGLKQSCPTVFVARERREKETNKQLIFLQQIELNIRGGRAGELRLEQ